MTVELVFLLLGIMLFGLILAAMTAYSRLKNKKEEPVVKEEKVYVDLGFEEEKKPDNTEKDSGISENHEKETGEIPQFFDIEYEKESAVNESDPVEPETDSPMFDIEYEEEESVIIETESMIDTDIDMDLGIKKCINCGSEVPNTRYCIYCGKSIDVEDES